MQDKKYKGLCIDCTILEILCIKNQRKFFNLAKRMVEVKGMMKKEKILRIALSGALVAAVTVAGVTMYRVESNEKKPESQQEELAMEEPSTGLSEGQKEVMESGANEPETTDVTANDAQAENTQALEGGENASSQGEESPQTEPETPQPTEETTDGQPSKAAETEDTSASVQPEINFSEDSSMLWPVSGQVVMDYSMDGTTYFSTLDQYKYNSAVLLAAATGDPVQAAANGKVVSVVENEETGTTVTLDMGNGYQAIYGQLKDLPVAEGQTVEAGTVLGYVNDPTKYYVKEGANLYFAMTKDGVAVDPMIYLETVTE